MTPTRDKGREAEFLADAHRQAALRLGIVSEWPQAVADRLEEGERLYGNRWATMAIPTLLEECAAEAADLGAWPLLAAQRVEQDPTLAAAEKRRLVGLLGAIAALGARAHSLTAAAQHIAAGATREDAA